MSDLGNLSSFLKEGNVPNLDWLDVDEEEYRALDRLPKQNLDIVPDLEALWAHEDKPSTFYVLPNKQGVPTLAGSVSEQAHTMGDLSQAHGRLRARAEDIAPVARFFVMRSPNQTELRRQLLTRLGSPTLRAHRGVIASALKEWGLLGKIYLAASDFPGCHNSPRAVTAFVRRFGCDAKFLVAKPECTGCIHAKKTGNNTNCAVFHKQLVFDVPYTEQLAAEVEQLQRTRGKAIQTSRKASPKDRIRQAFLAPPAQSGSTSFYSGVGEGQLPMPGVLPAGVAGERLIEASSLTQKRDEQRVTLKAAPIVAFLRREMLKGRSASELASALKVAFPVPDLVETRSHWEPDFQESGLYGVVYSTQKSFDDCNEGADFLAKHNPGIRAVVTGPKCASCIYNKIGRCMLYGKPLVKKAADLYTWPVVETVLLEHRNAGRLSAWDKTASLDATDPRQALKTIHARVSADKGKPGGVAGRMDVFYQWVGGPTQGHVATGQVKRDIVKTAAKYMNEGLYGPDLLRALKARFEVRDLTAARAQLRSTIAEQGLQGIYYVDASAYDDYGRGCEEAARLFRAKQVPYVKLGTKCGSCVFNHNRHCSQLNKPLVVDPPYVNKFEQQREILASGPSTQVSAPSLLAPSGLSMMTEYQLFNTGMDVDLGDVVTNKTKVTV